MSTGRWPLIDMVNVVCQLQLVMPSAFFLLLSLGQLTQLQIAKASKNGTVRNGLSRYNHLIGPWRYDEPNHVHSRTSSAN